MNATKKRPDNAPAPLTHVPARDVSAPGRKLHIGHFAFMRAVLQGLDTRESWNRYLRVEGEHDDHRNLNRTIAWIRDEFAAAAKRSERFGTARLIKIDAARIAATDPEVPSLEEFAAAHGLLEFSESEQLEEYLGRYRSATRRQLRRRRLISKQLEALGWLERQVAQPPHADDSVSAWLHPDLAGHLQRAGLRTIRQVVERVNGLGKRWWTGIRAIGIGKAERIMDWLRAQEGAIGLSIGGHVERKRSQLSRQDLELVVPMATAIVPLEKFIVPPLLDGSRGLNRAPQQDCLLSASTDHDALFAWIRAKPGISPAERLAIKRSRRIDPEVPEGPIDWLHCLSSTQRAYRKEAERFFLWAIMQQQKPLSSLNADDCDAYRTFLANPTPAATWCGPRSREKWGPLWRPFEGPLSLSAQRHAITILKNLFSFLVEQRYLNANPWAEIALPKIRRSAAASEVRRLAPSLWRFVRARLDALPSTSANHRLRFALLLFQKTGLKLTDAVAATTDHLRRADRARTKTVHTDGAAWLLSVPRKGERFWETPVDAEFTAALSTYLTTRGLHPDHSHPSNHGVYLLGKAVDVHSRAPWSPTTTRIIDPRTGIAASTLYTQIKNFLAECAEILATANPEQARQLKAAGTEWLRSPQMDE